MIRIVLRRDEKERATLQEDVEQLVVTCRGSVLAQEDGRMLIELAEEESVHHLGRQLDGWVVSPQVSKTAIPDTRLKVRAPRKG